MGATWRLLAEKMRSSKFLSFAIGGLFGDWDAIAATVAIAQCRPY